MRVISWLIMCFCFAVGAAPDTTPRAISGQVAVVADENTQFVANFIITDDDGNPITTTLEGDDSDLFQIVSGELSFITGPNYEFPVDQGVDNNYQVRVNGRDVSGDPYAVDVSVTVINVNEAPLLQNQLVYTRSEGEGYTIVLVAEDDEGDDFSYSLGGDDAALFEINNGILAPTSAFDFEQPTDTDANNQYQFDVIATDEFDAEATYNFTLTVENVEEQAQFNGFVRTEFEEVQVSGHSSPLFSALTLTDPDNEFSGHTLEVNGLLMEDTFVIDDSIDVLLSYDESSGEFSYDSQLVATLVATELEDQSKTYQLNFAAASNNENVNEVLNSIRYQSVADVPTPSRSWLVHIVSDEGLVTSLWRDSSYQTNVDPQWLTVEAGSQYSLFDVDEDGDSDLFSVDELGQVATFLNDGENEPSFPMTPEATGFFNDKNLGMGANVAFFDLNNDNIADALVANEQGFISYFVGQITGAVQSFELQSGESNPFNLVDVGTSASISIADVDGDLDGDVFIGNLGGEFLYYENIGTRGEPFFSLAVSNPVPVTLAGTSLVSVMADLDNDSDIDVILGNGEGEVTFFRNLGTATSPVFVEASDSDNPFFSDDFSAISNLAITDFDQNNLTDVVISDQDNHYLMTLSASFDVVITRRDNQAPQLIAGPSLAMVGSVEIPLPYSVLDEEGDSVTVTWNISPQSGLEIAADTGSELTLLADIVNAETHFTLTATLDDGRDQSSTEISVVVHPLGAEVAGYNLPQITLPTDLSVVEGEAFSLTAQLLDLDDDPLIIVWQQISGPVVVLDNTDTDTINFTAPEVTSTSVVRLQLTVSDALFDVVANVNITVVDVEEAPEEEEDNAFFSLSLSPMYLLLALLVWFKRHNHRANRCKN